MHLNDTKHEYLCPFWINWPSLGPTNTFTNSNDMFWVAWKKSAWNGHTLTWRNKDLRTAALVFPRVLLKRYITSVQTPRGVLKFMPTGGWVTWRFDRLPKSWGKNKTRSVTSLFRAARSRPTLNRSRSSPEWSASGLITSRYWIRPDCDHESDTYCRFSWTTANRTVQTWRTASELTNHSPQP